MKQVRAWFCIEAEIEDERDPEDWSHHIADQVDKQTVTGLEYMGVETVDPREDPRDKEMIGGSILTCQEELEKKHVAIGMEDRGGSFVQKLGNLVRRADRENFHRLKSAFPEYWEQYREIGEEIVQD